MTSHPIRMRRLGDHVLATNRAGHFALGGPSLKRAVEDPSRMRAITDPLISSGLLPKNALQRQAWRFSEARRHFSPGPLDYFILVPTLRCNLSCSYCQVSRASERAKGFDWDETTLEAVVELVGSTTAPAIKIEFQGGEPTLRPDLLRSVMKAVPSGTSCEFVICTNLQSVSDEILDLFDRPDVRISTSLDGSLERHSRQRQGDTGTGRAFFENLDRLIERYGPSKISALPTIDPVSPPDPDELISSYARLGIGSIYLRPVNYQGFARKRYPDALDASRTWLDYHRRFIKRLVELNYSQADCVFEETYFSLILRRIFRPGEDRHVDLRNPNPVGQDYVVIDFDGRAYPTDEARMLTRAGIIDLSIGDVKQGWDSAERAAMDHVASNDGDPDCEACAYKPYCGRDIFDDLARYGTIDRPRQETEFCRRHMDLFDLAFEMIHSRDEKVRHSLALWLDLPGEFPTPATVP